CSVGSFALLLASFALFPFESFPPHAIKVNDIASKTVSNVIIRFIFISFPPLLFYEELFNTSQLENSKKQFICLIFLKGRNFNVKVKKGIQPIVIIGFLTNLLN